MTRLDSAPRPQPLPAGEWHPATVVVAHLSAPAGAESAQEALARLMPRVMALVDAHQGTLVRQPDGLAVIFGAQSAHADDAVRAVQTALALRQAFSVPGLAARLAVSAGSVMAGYVGSPAQPEFVVTGEPLLAAAQVAEAATAGALWVTTPVRNATNHQFVYAPLPTRGNGLPADLAVWQLEGPRARPGSARGLPGVELPFIGRETALEAMLGLAQQNLPVGQGGVIWVEGEAGIGKTRLLQEFASRAVGLGAQVWPARCPPADQAYGLFAGLFRRQLGLRDDDPPAHARARLTAALAGWPPEAADSRPLLEWLLDPQAEAGRAPLPPDQLRLQLYAALHAVFTSLAATQPLVLLLDDLHWIDPPSANLLLSLSNLITTAPLLVVCALRWDETETADDRLVKVHGLMRPDQVLRLHLDRLAEVEAEHMLSELLADDALPADVRDFVLGRSEGNPYYLEEMVRALIEQDYLHRRAGHWQIDLSANLQDLPLPAALGALIQSRVDRLTPEGKYLLQCAAVIGGLFDDHLLAAVAELPGVPAALTRLEARGLLRRAARVHLWQFTHALMETTVYATLLPARRQALHRRVGEVLEARWRGALVAHAAELAYHFAQANAGERALVYLTLAAEAAASRYANEEALAYYQQAAVLLPDGPGPEATDALRWRIAVGLGEVYRCLGEYGASRAALEIGLRLLDRPALSAAQRAGVHRRLGETAQDSGQVEIALGHLALAQAALEAGDGAEAGPEARAEAARVLASQARAYLVQGGVELARAAATRAAALGAEGSDRDLQAAVWRLLAEIELAQAQLPRARAALDRAWEASRGDIGALEVGRVAAQAGRLCAYAGETHTAREYFVQAREVFAGLGARDELARVEEALARLG
jgi:tetratricopeptide (TPR) repeat protein